MDKLFGRFLRFWHCLGIITYGEHKPVDQIGINDNIIQVGCSCGKVFWRI